MKRCKGIFLPSEMTRLNVNTIYRMFRVHGWVDNLPFASKVVTIALIGHLISHEKLHVGDCFHGWHIVWPFQAAQNSCAFFKPVCLVSFHQKSAWTQCYFNRSAFKTALIVFGSTLLTSSLWWSDPPWFAVWCGPWSWQYTFCWPVVPGPTSCGPCQHPIWPLSCALLQEQGACLQSLQLMSCSLERRVNHQSAAFCLHFWSVWNV